MRFGRHIAEGTSFVLNEIVVLNILVQAIGEHNYATWSEYSQLLKLQRTRHEIDALDFAVADMRAVRCVLLKHPRHNLVWILVDNF